MYCRECGSFIKGKRKFAGNFLTEFVLYLFFIIPGLFYSHWRVKNAKNICELCGSGRVIPKNSPIINKLKNK